MAGARRGELFSEHEFQIDVATFEGCLAALPQITIEKSEYGTLSRFLIVAPNLWGMDIDLPIGIADAQTDGDRLQVKFYAIRGDEPPTITHPRSS